MDDKLTPADAGEIARRGRKLLRLGKITHRQYALLDALLWSCRGAGRATTRVSYGQLQQVAHLARSTVAGALRMLERLGLLQRQRHRILAIGANGGRVWKQLVSSYRLVVGVDSREFDGQTDSQISESIQVVEAVPSRAVKDAQEALRRIAQSREAKRAAEWHHARGWG